MPVQLPKYRTAVIDPRKLRDYVLNFEHATGQYKAAYFAQMGYTTENWQTLESDIREQIVPLPAEPGQPSAYGQKYTITGQLRSSSGARRWITTVWIVRPGKDYAELVTVAPAAKRKESSDE